MFNFVGRLSRRIANEVVDKAIKRMTQDQYTENLFEIVPVAKKVGVINLMESIMRAEQGIPPGRPLGSHMRFSPWNQLLFNPVHLHRFPTPENVGISSSVTIGKNAKKPLTISTPIMIAAMSFGGALSKDAKIALAKGASKVGTATNTGEAGLMEEEREAASLLIGQYNRGGWLNTPEKYKRLDAIEIQLGQGAQGSTPQRTSAKNIGEDFREVYGLAENEDSSIRSRLPGVNKKEDFIELVKKLKSETGVPVGLKFAATHYLEKEIQIALEAEVDFLTIDGAEGGTHASAPILEDDLGLPTLYAISRANKFLTKKDATKDVSLIATGGLVTPGDFLKALALGADALYIGTIAVMSLIGEQMTKVMPFEPPTSMAVYNAKATDQLDVNKAANNLFKFINAATQEMGLVCYSLGKTSLSDVSLSDLCTLDPFMSRALGVELGYVASEEQDEFFEAFTDLPLHEMERMNENPNHEQHLH